MYVSKKNFHNHKEQKSKQHKPLGRQVVANLLKICNVYYIICQLLSNLVIYIPVYVYCK